MGLLLEGSKLYVSTKPGWGSRKEVRERERLGMHVLPIRTPGRARSLSTGRILLVGGDSVHTYIDGPTTIHSPPGIRGLPRPRSSLSLVAFVAEPGCVTHPVMTVCGV